MNVASNDLTLYGFSQFGDRALEVIDWVLDSPIWWDGDTISDIGRWNIADVDGVLYLTVEGVARIISEVLV